MGGDHWLLEKLGFWDESYHVPADRGGPATGGGRRSRGTIVEAVTESVDVLPTICDFIGVEVPVQADGWSLAPFLRGEPAPEHWRDTAHFEWSFSDPANLLAETVLRDPDEPLRAGRVAWAAVQVRPVRRRRRRCSRPCSSTSPSDPEQPHNLLADDGAAGAATPRGRPTQELLQWQMRTAERTLSGSFLHPERGLVEAATRGAEEGAPGQTGCQLDDGAGRSAARLVGRAV